MTIDIADSPFILPKRTRSLYLVAAFVVTPVWSIVPLSWVYLAYTILYGNFWSNAYSLKIPFVLSVFEVIFCMYYYYLTLSISGLSPLSQSNAESRVSALPRAFTAGLVNFSQHPTFDKETPDLEIPAIPKNLIRRLHRDDPLAVDFRVLLRNWFGMVPFSSIRVQHLHTWLYASLYHMPFPSPEHLPPAHLSVLENAVDMLENRTGIKIPAGTDSSIKPICLTVDRVNVYHRPLIFYAAVKFGNWLTRYLLETQWGCRVGCYEGLEYVIRVPEAWDPDTGPRPIVFWHGLGLGLLQYNRFLWSLLEDLPDYPLLIPLQPHVSQDVFHPRYIKPMMNLETTSILVGLLAELGWAEDGSADLPDEAELKEPRVQKGVTFVSHSNGSYAHAWMLKRYPRLVTRSCFVDPVTFCSWEGDMCYNFLYRPCRSAYDALSRYFIGTELGVANLMQRNFDWAANALWCEEIPNAHDPSKTLFLLGGKDPIIRSDRVKRYFSLHGVNKNVWLDPEGHHGTAINPGGRGHREILRWLKGSK